MVMQERPTLLKGETPRVMTGCGHLYLTLNEYEGALVEVFPKLGKSGVCANVFLEALGRLVSLAMRHGATMEEIQKHLVGLTCQVPYDDDKGWRASSCPDAIARILVNKYGNGNGNGTN